MNEQTIETQTNHVPAIEVADLKLSSGWSALVALNDSAGNSFDPDGWKTCLQNPQNLMDDPDRCLKVDSSSKVILKTIQPGPHKIKVVIKHHTKAPGIKGMFRSLQPSRALRNFRTAMKLYTNNLPTARPLAALTKSMGLAATADIYITEYIPNSLEIYSFFKDHKDNNSPLDLRLKRRLGSQISRIFAGLHELGLWHHDAKAANFLVQKTDDGEHKIVLVDLDGIRDYSFLSSNQRFVSLAKLTSNLMWSSDLTTADYLRIFTDYANMTGLEKKQRKSVFKFIERHATAIRLLTMARTAMKTEKSDQKA